jgi:DNA-binding MarR family transcriptional regulator
MAGPVDITPPSARTSFSFLTNHGLALVVIAQDPRARMRDIAADLGITERATQRIIGELVDAGYVTRSREGRRNAYTVRTDLPIALSGPRKLQVGDLLDVLAQPAAA